MHQIIETGDGSLSLFHESLNESYHSIHGAVQESKHVFIKAGLELVASNKSEIRILEVGLGTALNAMLSIDFAVQNPDIIIHYVGIEAFPIESGLVEKLSVPRNNKHRELFLQIHSMIDGEQLPLANNFLMTTHHQTFLEFQDTDKFDLIFYDAFGPAVQPEMWNFGSLKHCADLILPQGVWVSYCAKGVVRRTLAQNGFIMERLPGPPGKREMLRGTYRPI